MSFWGQGVAIEQELTKYRLILTGDVVQYCRHTLIAPHSLHFDIRSATMYTFFLFLEINLTSHACS